MRRLPSLLLAATSLALLASCDLLLREEPGVHAQPPHHAGGRDAGTADGEIPDSGGHDAGAIDAGVPPPPEGLVRVASYNVHRFFDTVCESSSCGGDSYEELPSQAQFDARADQIAKAIRGLGAHAVLLQEIETQAALDALAARLPEMTAMAFGEIGYAGSVDVGVLARGQIGEVRKHRARTVLTRPDGTTTSFARELLEAHLTIDGAPIVLFAAHFRSKHNDDPGRRLAEAQAAASIVATTAAERPDALVVFGGDLNDEPGTPPIDALESSGKLLRVAGELPDDEAATYWYSRPQAIDHLFVDTRAAGGYVPGTARVAHGVGWGLGGSDHAAIVADFLPPQ